jgi:hypothetical protein
VKISEIRVTSSFFICVNLCPSVVELFLDRNVVAEVIENKQLVSHLPSPFRAALA